MSAAHALVRDALALRRWTLDLLGGADRLPPACHERSWRLFLETERCALPVKRRLRRPGALDAAVETAALTESQRALSARARLMEVARLTRERGWRVAVLKGGLAALADDTAVDLWDVDLLASPTDAPALAAALDVAGYEPRGPSSALHLPGRHRSGGLGIEVHVTTDSAGADESPWQRIRPIPSFPTLWRLAPADHLWHLLVHITVQHPHRRGVIRDLMLMRQALAECGAEERERVRQRAEAHEHAESMALVLRAGERLLGDDSERDPFERDLAHLHFLKLYARRFPLPALLEGETSNWVVALAMGGPERRRLWRRTWQRTHGSSLRRPIAWLERRSPPLGRAVRLVARLAWMALAIAIAVPLSWAARRGTSGVLAGPLSEGERAPRASASAD